MVALSTNDYDDNDSDDDGDNYDSSDEDDIDMLWLPSCLSTNDAIS